MLISLSPYQTHAFPQAPPTTTRTEKERSSGSNPPTVTSSKQAKHFNTCPELVLYIPQVSQNLQQNLTAIVRSINNFYRVGLTWAHMEQGYLLRAMQPSQGPSIKE